MKKTKKDNKEEKINQVFCRRCGGLKQLKVNGKKVKPTEWMKYGMASDIGCCC